MWQIIVSFSFEEKTICSMDFIYIDLLNGIT